jgi:hypothetical protein
MQSEIQWIYRGVLEKFIPTSSPTFLSFIHFTYISNSLLNLKHSPYDSDPRLTILLLCAVAYICSAVQLLVLNREGMAELGFGVHCIAIGSRRVQRILAYGAASPGAQLAMVP